MESWICNFYLSVAAHKLSSQIRPWDTLACCWDVKQQTNKLCLLQLWPLSSFFSLSALSTHMHTASHTSHFSPFLPPRWPSGKASASRAEDPGFESRLRWDFFGVESYQWLKNWHSSGYPARRLVLWGQRWDWSARCQYTVTGWGRTFDLQLLSQCGSTSNCLSRSVPEIH